jgi:hypothetical protein
MQHNRDDAQHPDATPRCEALAHNSDVQPPCCHAAPPHGRPATTPPRTRATPPRCEAFRCKRWLHNAKLQGEAVRYNRRASSPRPAAPPSRSREGRNEAWQRRFATTEPRGCNEAWHRSRFATERRRHNEAWQRRFDAAANCRHTAWWWPNRSATERRNNSERRRAPCARFPCAPAALTDPSVPSFSCPAWRPHLCAAKNQGTPQL